MNKNIIIICSLFLVLAVADIARLSMDRRAVSQINNGLKTAAGQSFLKKIQHLQPSSAEAEKVPNYTSRARRCMLMLADILQADYDGDTNTADAIAALFEKQCGPAGLFL